MIQIDSKQIILGESTDELIADRGFSPQSYGLNLTKKKGELYFSPTATDIAGATLTGAPITRALDRTLAGPDCYFGDNEGAFYTLANDGTFTKKQTIAADSFARGTSDLIQYYTDPSSVYVFATGLTTIIRFNGSTLDSGAPTTDFWTGLSSGVRHPMEVVEGSLYIGDYNEIHVTNGITTTEAYVTLPPDVNITSLRKHPDGKNLIAFCGRGQNYNHTRNSQGRIYIVDLSIKSWVSEIDIEAQVEGSKTVGGVVYVTYGTKLGYFNGNGLTPLKTLSSATTYSHEMDSIEDILVVRDGRYILQYGNLGAGNVFWRSYRTPVAQDITCVAYRGDNKLIAGYADGANGGVLQQTDYDNSGSGAQGNFFSNVYNLDSEVEIRRLRLIHDITSGATIYTEYYDHETATYKPISTFSAMSNTAVSRENVNIKTDLFQFTLSMGGDDIGFKVIRFDYGNIK